MAIKCSPRSPGADSQTIKTWEGKRGSVSCYGKGLRQPQPVIAHHYTMESVYGHLCVFYGHNHMVKCLMAGGTRRKNPKLLMDHDKWRSDTRDLGEGFGRVAPGVFLIKLDVFSRFCLFAEEYVGERMERFGERRRTHQRPSGVHA